MHKILLAFSALMTSEIRSMGDARALQLLLELLERQDIFILSKKDGPMFYALIKHFRLSGRPNGHDPFDYLDPQRTCRVLIQWRLLQIKLQEYNLKKIARGSEIKQTKNQNLIQFESRGE